MIEEEKASALASLLSCPANSAAQLARAMHDEIVDRQKVIVHQGDQCASCWIVISGQVQVRLIGLEGQVNLLNSYGPGEMFGAYPRPTVNRADIFAQSKLHLLQISTSELWRLAKENDGIGVGLSKLMAQQLDSVLDRLAERITLTAVGRVYAELLRLADAENGHVIERLPLVAGLALSVQTTRETASRAMSALERRGIVKRDGRRMEIISRRMLEELVI